MTLQHFGLLTDENIDPLIVQFLRDADFDVLDVNEEGWRDEKIASYCLLLISNSA